MLCATCQTIEFRRVGDLEEKDGGKHALKLRRQYDAYLTSIASFKGRQGSQIREETEDQKRLWDHFGFVYFHRPGPEVVESSRKGCHLCNVLLESLTRGEGSVFPENPASEYSGVVLAIHRFFDRQRKIVVDVYCEGRKGTLSLSPLPARFAQVSDYCTENYAVDLSTGSANNLRLARYWLRQCEQTHPECHAKMVEARMAEEPVLPDYVLDVGNPQDANPRLVLARGAGRVARYATLSYCWGKTSRASTTCKANLASYMKSIDISTLPKTLQDAIQTARGLRIRFLWVDALCVIRDSQEHWEQQSAQLGAIFRNSTVTIAADSGRSAGIGFFVMRSSLASRPCRLPRRAATSAGLPRGPWFLGHDQYDPIYRLALDYPASHLLATRWPDPAHERDTARMNETSALDRRAWGFQEAVLSPRVLLFTPAGVSWQCGLRRLYESCPVSDLVDIQPRYLACLSDGVGAPVDWWQRYDDWYLAMSQFNTRCVPRRADKMLALSALARAFKSGDKGRGDEYLAGLWLKDLRFGLLWTPQSNGGRCRPRNGPYVGPSWSWVSLDAMPVDFIYHDENNSMSLRGHQVYNSFSVLRAFCTPLDSDPFGRILSGFLTIHAKVVEVSILDMDEEQLFNFLPESLSGWLPLTAVGLVGAVGVVRLDEPGKLDGPIFCIPLLYDELEWHEIAKQRVLFWANVLTLMPDDWLGHYFGKHELDDTVKFVASLVAPKQEKSGLDDKSDSEGSDGGWVDCGRSDSTRKSTDECSSRWDNADSRFILCLVIVPTVSGMYRRVGVAELWDGGWFEKAPSMRATII